MAEQNTGDVPPKHADADAAPGQDGIPRKAWIVFALIYLFTVPWYLPRDWIDPTLWAFPAWSLVMIGGATLLAAFNAYVFLRLWPEDDDHDNSSGTATESRTERSP